MKMKFLKIAVLSAVFAVSCIGITVNSSNKKIGGEVVKVSLLTLGTQAQAYCNEPRYSGEWYSGKCDGAFNDQMSRCEWVYSSDSPNCWTP